MSELTYLPKPILGVSALLRHKEHFLLAKRGNEPSKGLWSLPGGKLEWGENLDHAAAREVLEETGINAENLEFAEFVEIIRAEYHYVIAVFTAQLSEKEPPVAGDDASDARWFLKSEIEALDAASKITLGTYDRICRLSETSS